jgi:RNA polymerase sigma factor (sigma-70 family)
MEQTRTGPEPIDLVAELYARYARRLRRIVGSNVRAPDAVIEDACQVAWSRLIPRAQAVPLEAALPWLVTTASREAIRLARHGDRELSLETLVDDGVALPQYHGPEEVVALRERLGAVRSLPVRQQQLVWLAGLGFSYGEMADCTGATRRTVERQLLRAKHALRDAA